MSVAPERPTERVVAGKRAEEDEGEEEDQPVLGEERPHLPGQLVREEPEEERRPVERRDRDQVEDGEPHVVENEEPEEIHRPSRHRDVTAEDAPKDECPDGGHQQVREWARQGDPDLAVPAVAQVRGIHRGRLRPTEDQAAGEEGRQRDHHPPDRIEVGTRVERQSAEELRGPVTEAICGERVRELMYGETDPEEEEDEE